MIILRQKEFAQWEKDMMKEFYNKTNGLKQLPKITNSRDVIRFNTLASDAQNIAATANGLERIGFNIRNRISNNSPAQVDIESAKTLLNNIGLPIASKNIERFVRKYNNPETIRRWAKIQELKKSQQTPLEKFKSSLISTGRGLKNGFIALPKILSSKLKYNQTFKSPFCNEDINNYQKQLANRNNTNIAKICKKSGDSEFDHTKNQINLGPGKIDSSILSHENGHARSFKTDSGNELFNITPNLEISKNPLKKISEELGTLARENHATSYALSSANKLGVDDKTKKELSKRLDTAYDTYWQSTVAHLPRTARLIRQSIK